MKSEWTVRHQTRDHHNGPSLHPRSWRNMKAIDPWKNSYIIEVDRIINSRRIS